MKFSLIKWFVLIMLWMPSGAQGQDVKEMSERLENLFKLLRPSDRKVLVEGYVAAMTSSLLSSEEKQLVESVFSDLQGLHVTVSPELESYIWCVNRFYGRQEKENLMAWLEGMQKVLAAKERRRTLVKGYLESTLSLAKDRILFNSSGHQWQVKGLLEWHQGEPLKLYFREADLFCMTRKDTICIYATSGSFQLGEQELNGKGGKVKWNDAGEEMSAELGDYRIHLKVPGYTADSVCFHYESKYQRPFWGTLKDNALKYVRTKDGLYPEFTSYNTDVEIRDIYKNMHFLGGITYRGIKFSGTGTEEHPALLQIVPNDSIQMKLYSKQFLFDSVRVMSGQTAMEILMDSGEITHSNVHFSYSIPQQVVHIKRISEQSSHLPFKDSYHRILFDMEEIYWPLDSSYLEMRMSSRSGLFKATIESMNFFSDQVYDGIQGMDEINPLNGLLKCSLELQSNTFTIGDYAGFLKKPDDQLRRQIVLLSYEDFVDYNEARDEVTLKQRLFDYTRARIGKQDYDNIRFTSQPGKDRVNAVMDVRNYNLKIVGVDQFMISETRNIYVEPSDKQVVMLKNRDMAFNGKLNAGMFDMYGQNLFFSYDKYTIALPKVDSTSMYLAGRDKNIRGKKVGSLIRDITGEVVIDKPDNKSGKKEDPGFPVLNSTKESYVYFDDAAIQGGQYKRDSFYYKINPYTIKGINDASRFRYAFGGTLISNIVSPIEDTLKLLEDRVLGLTYQTPSAGLELYGKGRIYSRIVLNRQGFLAEGKVKMNKSIFESDTILMLPEEMQANTREIKVEAVKDQRPQASGKNVMIKYVAETGNLQATSVSSPFEVYEGRVRHEGNLMVYENLLDASGKLELEGAQLHAGLFNLQANQVLAGSTALNITSVLNKDICLNTSDVKATIDLATNTGKFVNNAANNQAIFSSSRYNCSFESFTWYMKDACLNIGIEDPGMLAGIWEEEDMGRIPVAARNRFVSTDPVLDSLNFIAPLARYDLRSGDIACHWVNHVDVANGRFYPDKGNLYVQANGDIREFNAGRLLCERGDSTKLLTDVDFKLKGRYAFAGAGNYQYVSEEKKQSTIHFTQLGTDSLKLIVARARQEEKEPLFLNDGFIFKGDITLHSRQPDLYFAGCVKLTVDTTWLKHRWVNVKNYLSANHVRIPLKLENRDDKQQRIYNGVYLNTDRSFKPYAAFLSKRLFYNDDLLIAGSGEVEWSSGMKQYILSDTLRDKYYRFRYDPETATVLATGVIQLDLKIPGMYQKIVGDISYQFEQEKLKINRALYLMDFTLLSRMEGVLLKDFADKKLKTMETNLDIREKIYEIYDKSVVPVIEKQLTNSAANIPDSLNRLFVLDSLILGWNEQTRSYMANGEVNVVAVKGHPVAKTMNVKMELLRSRSGNQYFMYIYDDKIWYYFEYSDRSLYTLSSNEEYNEVIRTEKADKKVVQTKEKETLYTITLCPDSKKERFLKRVK